MITSRRRGVFAGGTGEVGDGVGDGGAVEEGVEVDTTVEPVVVVVDAMLALCGGKFAGVAPSPEGWPAEASELCIMPSRVEWPTNRAYMMHEDGWSTQRLHSEVDRSR